MTFREIDARYRTAVLSGESAGWDDPESGEETEEHESGYRDADEDATYDEAGEQGTGGDA